MLMPKATMDKNDSVVPRENEVRFSRQVFFMKPET